MNKFYAKDSEEELLNKSQKLIKSFKQLGFLSEKDLVVYYLINKNIAF